MSTPGRRFKAGDQFKVDGVYYRIVHGDKAPDDLRLDWSGPGPVRAWRPVSLEHVAIIIDAIGENENFLFPPPHAGEGKVWQFLLKVRREGWRQANHDLNLERDRRHHPDLFGETEQAS